MLVVHIDIGRAWLRQCHTEIELGYESGKKEISQPQGTSPRKKDEPSDSLVDRRRILRAFVERPEPSNLYNRNLTSPPQTFTCRFNRSISVIVFLPVGGDEKDVIVDYDLTVVYLSSSCWLRELVFDADIAGVLESLSDWNNSLEDFGEATMPLGGENVTLDGT